TACLDVYGQIAVGHRIRRVHGLAERTRDAPNEEEAEHGGEQHAADDRGHRDRPDLSIALNRPAELALGSVELVLHQLLDAGADRLVERPDLLDDDTIGRLEIARAQRGDRRAKPLL